MDASDVDGLEERRLISTGVEEIGSWGSCLLALVASRGTSVGSVGGAIGGRVVVMVLLTIKSNSRRVTIMQKGRINERMKTVQCAGSIS